MTGSVEGWWAASYVALWFLVVVLCVVVVALARQIGTLHLRVGPRGALEIDQEGPALNEGRPPIETTDIEGRAVTIGGGAQLLLFVSPGCTVCERVLPSISSVGQAVELPVLVLTDVDVSETRIVFAHKRVHAPVVAAQEAFTSYEVPGTPYLVVLDHLGVVRAKGTVNNLEQIEGLVDTARDRGAASAGPHHGEGAVSAGPHHGEGAASAGPHHGSGNHGDHRAGPDEIGRAAS